MSRLFGAAYDIGKKGEILTARWYQKQGFRILEKNYHSRFGEVDIIAHKKGQLLVFVEVKSRTQDFVRPCETVDIRKQKKLILTAQQYLMTHLFETEQIRFDVMEVFLQKKGHERFFCIENAFEL